MGHSLAVGKRARIRILLINEKRVEAAADLFGPVVVRVCQNSMMVDPDFPVADFSLLFYNPGLKPEVTRSFAPMGLWWWW